LDRIRQAQEARGLLLRGGLLPRLGALRLQIVPLVLGLVEDAGIRGQALEARGFGSRGPHTTYRIVEDPPGQRLFRAVALVVAAGAVALRLLASWPAAVSP
jgi:energy-coupling factor transport system permease protein